MYINTYNLNGQALLDAYAANNAQYDADRATTARNQPPRVALRRLLAYLAIRWGTAWLDASEDVLEGWLPLGWATLHHHEIVTYLELQGITPEHCTLA